MRSLDEITRDLAAAQDELLAVDSSDLIAADAIRVRQARLREEASRFARLLEDSGSTEAIRRELAARRDQLNKLRKQKIDLIKQSSAGSGTAPDALPEATLNRKLMAANGGDQIESRIIELMGILERRGETPSG